MLDGLTAVSGFSFAEAGAILDLVGLIYEATVDPSRWQALLDAYVQAVGGCRGWLVLNSGSRDGTELVRWSTCPDEDGRLSAEQLMADGFCGSAGTGSPEGAVQTTDLASRAGTSDQSATYRGLCESSAIRYQLSGVFRGTADASSRIVAARGEQEGPFTEPAIAILRSLIPHLQRATLLNGEICSLRLRLAASTAHLDRCPCPFLLTDARGRVIYANTAASRTAGLMDGLVIGSGQLSLMSAGSQAALVDALEQVAAHRSPQLLRLEVKRPSRKSPYLLLLMPAPSCDVVSSGLAHAAVSVLIVDSEARPKLDPAILRELFSLTPTEARVTAKLGGGWSAEEIAEELGVSLETIRTHIRRILSKTATARQGQLISLVLRTAPFSSFYKETPHIPNSGDASPPS